MNIKISLDNWNGSSFITNMEKILHEEWGNLCAEYQIANVPLLIRYDDEIYDIMYRVTMNNNDCETLKDFDKTYRKFINPNAVLATWLIGTAKDKSLVQWVLGKLDTFIELMFLNLPKYDKFVDYLKFELRHEMGHVLSNIDIKKHSASDEDFKERIHALRQEQDNMIAAFRECNKGKRVSDEEFYKFYFNLPMEILADEAVGYTWMDHLEHVQEYTCKPNNVEGE
jgi:hypothetical protein